LEFDFDMSRQPRVLIVGASIAGPMTAYWLAKGGARVTVVERSPTLRPQGQAVDIRTTGVAVMRKIPGMEAAVRAKRQQVEGMSFVRDDGRPYGVIRATGNPDRQSLLSEYEIDRGDLSQILYRLTKDDKNVRYVFGEQIASIKQDPKNAVVEFANGLAASEYDLVVACDGATSRTRATMFGGGVRDHVESVDAWAAYFSIDQDIVRGKVAQGYSAVGGRSVSIEQDSGGQNRVLLMRFHPRDRPNLMVGFRQAQTRGEEALKRHIARLYHGAGWRTDEVMEAMLMTGAHNFYASEMVQVQVPNLYRGRLVLVGDAGYAAGLTGLGTTLAMTGAYVLAGELLVKHKGDLSAGLKGYEERMKPVIADMQKIPPRVRNFASPQTAWGLWLRNGAFALVARTNLLEYAQRLFGGGAAGTADKYGLPDYDWGP
jgi:2-polyprenyl-6-methoxyphenol hydroxylase-like FAD-dependent oxidoreductase